MGTPAPEGTAQPVVPACTDTVAAADQTEAVTLAAVADEESWENDWYVVRKQGTSLYLGETVGGDAAFGAFGPATYFYATAAEAQTVAASEGQSVRIHFNARILPG